MRIKSNTTIRGFFKNIGFTLLLNLLIKPISLLVESYTHNAVDHQEWATYASLLSLCYVFTSLADLGINQYVTKVIAEKPDEYLSIFPKFFSIKIFLTFFFPFLMISIGIILEYSTSQLWFLFWIALSYSGFQLFQLFRAKIQGFQLFKFDAFASNFEKIFFSVLLIILLYLGATSLSTIVYGRLISIILAITLVIFILKKKHTWLSPKYESYSETKRLIKSSIPFALIILLTGFNEKIDQVMLERLAFNRAETSIYAAAYRWLDAAMVYLWIILPIFFARFSFHQISKKEKQNLLDASIGITSIPLLIITIFSFFHGELLFVLFSNSSNTEVILMAECFKILSISLFLQGCFAVLSTYLTSNGYTSEVSWSLTVSIIVNIILNFIYIPKFGAIAAAYTTLISTSFLSIAYIVVFVKKHILPLPWGMWGKIFSVALITIVATFFLQKVIHYWIITLIFSSIVSISLSFILNLIQLKTFLKK